MTVCDVEEVLSGWNHLRVTDGEKVLCTTENGFVVIPENIGDAEVIGLAIENNTLVVEIEELEDEDE